MAEITSTGYATKTQNEYFAEEQQIYRDIDSDWNLDPSTPDGLKIAHDAEIFAAFDEMMQQAFNSRDPNKAQGYDLDVVGALTGYVRSAGSYSTATVTMTGNAGQIIPLGTRFDDTSGYRWTLDQTWTLDSTGSATGDITCSTIGQVEALSNTITKIVDNVSGLTSVTNPDPATPGNSRQSDASFRASRNAAVGKPGNNQVDSMTGQLFSVDSVRRVKIYENDTGSADVSDDNPYGLPAHSISVLVDGGTDEDVAMAVYLKKNPGVLLNQAGTGVTVTVTSPTYATNKKVIKFSRPIYVDVMITVTIANDGSLPSQNVLQDEIRDAFTEFNNGELVPTEYGFKQNGFGIGESVPYSTIYTPINSILGKYGNSYVAELDLNGAKTNLAIEFNQLSRWITSNIVVAYQ